MKQYQGETKNIKKSIIGSVAKANLSIWNRKNKIYASEAGVKGGWRYSAQIISSENELRGLWPIRQVKGFKKESIEDLNDNDILLVDKTGDVFKFWDVTSAHNSLLITEECNCRCIMCPQPPRADRADLHKNNSRVLKLLNGKHVKDICLTGGEPLKHRERLLNVLKICNKKFPHARIVLLTNGTYLRSFAQAKEIVFNAPAKLQFCISLHADNNLLHDKITRLNGSFRDTIIGIQNLGKLRQFIEIRYVISRLNYRRLPAFAEFLYRNLPFVGHVAFMALEISGLAKKNFKKIWIDPLEYNQMLKEAVKVLRRRNINVSVYNIPLCLLDQTLWKYARHSISDWKRVYNQECELCDYKPDCGGLFETSEYQSANIKPLVKT